MSPKPAPSVGSTPDTDTTQAPGVSGNAGLVIVTPIVSEANHTPVVPTRPLQGSFTIVNTMMTAPPPRTTRPARRARRRWPVDSFPSGGRLELIVGTFNSTQESYFGTSSQSLGTFAGGQRLVPVDIQ